MPQARVSTVVHGVGTSDAPARLRVLHVIPSMSDSSGGPARAMASIEHALAGQGVDVVTVTTDDDGPRARLPRTPPSGERHGAACRHVFGMSTRAYKTSWPMWDWLRRETGSFDVVHVHGLFSFAPLAAAWWARRRGVPYVVRPLGVLNRYGMRTRRARLKRLSLRWLEGPLLRDAARVQFTAEAEREEAADLGLAYRAEVLPLGIDPLPAHSPHAFRQAHGIDDEAPLVLFCSRVDPKKNVEGLLDAFAMLAPSSPRLRLAVCGTGADAYLAQLHQRCRALGIAERVAWAGHVGGPMKASAFAAAQVFALPSYSENFGIAVAEALGAGLPCVVGHGVALARDVAEAGAGVATGTDATGIAAGLAALLDDETARRQAAQRARVLARERFGPEAMATRLVAMYRAMLVRTGRAA